MYKCFNGPLASVQLQRRLLLLQLCFSDLIFLCGKIKKMGTCWILLGLLSICSLCFSQECAQELIENVDFPGSDITFLYSPDARHCQQLCTEHPSCLFFTFVRQDWTRDNRNFYCYLKSTPSLKPKVRTPLQGVTSGFSLKNCPSELEQPCRSQLYKNVDFLGADYKSLFTSSDEECHRVCTQDPHCRFFTFVNDAFRLSDIRYKCHLKHSWSVPRIPVIKREVGAVSGFSHKLQITQYFGPVCQGKLLLNTDIPGHDIDKLPAASAEHCQALCSDRPRCTYFSYNSDNFQCYLKGNRDAMVTRAKVGFTSGIPVHFCQMDDSWLQVSHGGVSFEGSDFRSELMDDPDTCQRTCTTDPLCQFYTYFNKSYSNPDFRRRCYLKRVITAPAPPEVKKYKNLVSGFSLKNLITSNVI
ncbi:coagulation factor XI-like isoform X2 [Limanda limanda]|uniref:coagulation factor XI-like isoform X2 n=1 Tax=Limanda limanda TaxID=27771 RepID=UPI0029C815CE|nr:coagulation factor XI-like isoform X2 [Limanda limanda]